MPEGPNMPTRDPEATKARIFKAATTEFAAYGISGARIDRIARNAQANKQLIYSYFGDKNRLFEHVLNRAMDDVASAVSTDITDLDAWTEDHLNYHQEHPELMRLMLWEALESDPYNPVGRIERQAHYRAKTQKVADAQAKGIINPDVPPAHMLMLLMSLINYQGAIPQLRVLLLEDEDSPLREWIKMSVRRIAQREETDRHG